MATLLLLLLLPVLLIVGLVVFLWDFHTPLFIQNRLGKDKKPFKIIKFRTMLDGKITGVGRVLRATGMDELPQLLNIAIGQMRFVGPRPLTENDIERLGWDIPYYEIRWSVVPGIVGLAQLSPICHKKMSWFLDKQYIEQNCLKLDLKILAGSVLIPLVGKSQMIKWIHKK